MQSGRLLSSLSAALLWLCLATFAPARVTDEGSTGEAGNQTAVNPDIVGAGGVSLRTASRS